MNITDTILIGFDQASPDYPVMIIGRKKPNEPMEVLTVFTSEEAVELYEKLTKLGKVDLIARISESLMVGYSFIPEKNTAVLTVGRKRLNESVEIINAFEGEEAIELYGKLTTRRDGSGQENPQDD